jgi:hypothetical protein
VHNPQCRLRTCPGASILDTASALELDQAAEPYSLPRVLGDFALVRSGELLGLRAVAGHLADYVATLDSSVRSYPSGLPRADRISARLEGAKRRKPLVRPGSRCRKRGRLLETPTVHRPIEIAERADLSAVVADLIEDADEDLVARD